MIETEFVKGLQVVINTMRRLKNENEILETNLYKLTGAERKVTATDRIKGMYTPTSGMPGIELSQLMDGVDYGGTMVTGLLFSEGQGWDKQGWYDFPWDNYGTSNIVKFTADGSTAASLVLSGLTAVTLTVIA